MMFAFIFYWSCRNYYQRLEAGGPLNQAEHQLDRRGRMHSVRQRALKDESLYEQKKTKGKCVSK